MKTLVVFDSNFGNTRQVAGYIAGQIGSSASLMHVDDFKQRDLEGVGLLIVGCPINAWSPTPKIKAFLNKMAARKLNGINVAAFDTRIRSFISGNAAKKIARSLTRSGGHLLVPGEGFYVKAKEGPLFEGEQKRVQEWAGALLAMAEKNQR